MRPAMKKPLKYVMALGAFFVAAVAISACGSSLPSNAVVTIDGNPVTLQAYDHWMFIAAKGQSQGVASAPVIVPNDPPKFNGCLVQVRKQIPSLAKTPDAQIRGDCKQLFTSLNATVLDFLIKTYWYELEAKRLHISLTKTQINQAFETAKNQQFKTPAAFTAFLKTTGQTLPDIYFRVRANKLFTILASRHKVTVTPATIAAYYQSHQSQFGTPETRNIRIVRTNTLAPATAAKTALKKGQSWQKVAAKYSIDTTTKKIGGLLTGVTRGQEETALNNAAFAAPANKILGPIHGTFGYYVFEVIKVNAGSQQSLAQATPLIKQLLTSQNQTAEQAAVDKVAGGFWKAKTHCQSAYYMVDCGGPAPPHATTPTIQTAPATPPATTAPATPTTATATTPTSAATTPSATPTSSATAPAAGSTPTVTLPTSTSPAATATAPSSTTTAPKKKKK
jgi:parvulin-like peptidyl-prolyl isomerase